VGKSEGTTIRSYRDLVVWQKAIALIVRLYALTKPFPVDERFGLTQQMRRAAVSIAANIAEGHARLSTPSFMHFISIAMGSLAELETHTIVARQLGYLEAEAADDLVLLSDEINRMLRALYKRLETR
jgi:four helix bundle protein